MEAQVTIAVWKDKVEVDMDQHVEMRGQIYNSSRCVYYLLLYKTDFPGGSDGKESTSNVGDLGSIPGLGVPWRRTWQNMSWRMYPCLENPHGQRCLTGYSPQGCKELDMTEGQRMHINWVDQKICSDFSIRCYRETQWIFGQHNNLRSGKHFINCTIWNNLDCFVV